MRQGGQYSTRITDEFLSRFEGLPDQSPFASILLYDYTTGEHDIHLRHDEGLRNHFYTYLGPNMSIWVIGFASRLGGDHENNILSDQRARTVANRISFQSGFRGSIGTVFVGETHSQGSLEEDSQYRRAVLVLAYRRPPYQPPEIQPRALTAFNHFQIRQSWGIQGGAAVSGCDYHFVIDYDLRIPGHPDSAAVEYAFLGLGTGAGVSIPGAEQVGEGMRNHEREVWNYFTTPNATTPDHFGGLARMTSLSFNAMDFSVGPTFFTMMPIRQEPITIENFAGPESIGLGGSLLFGNFIQTRLLS